MAKQVEIVNLTRHCVTVCDERGNELMRIPTTGVEARYVPKYKRTTAEDAGNPELAELSVPLFTFPPPVVEGVPDPRPGTVYLVPFAVHQLLPDRVDLVSAGRKVMDRQRRIRGCIGLIAVIEDAYTEDDDKEA